MTKPTQTQNWWTIELESMPGFDKAMKRVYAWYENEIIDRPPIRFMAHNAFLNADVNNEYFVKLEELTRYALERCPGKFLVGYTDLHCSSEWVNISGSGPSHLVRS